MPIQPPQSPGSSDPRKVKQKGSGFTNLNKVIDANKGNQLGSAVAGGLQQTGQNIQNKAEQATSSFNQGLQQNAFGDQQKAQRDAIMSKANVGAVTDEDASTFNRFRSGQYTGPKELEGKADLLNEAGRANELARTSNTQQGRYGLLQQFNPSAKYTQGTQRTDALLLGQDAGKIQRATGALRGLSRGVEQKASQAEGAAQEATAQAKTFGADTNAQLESGLSGELSPAQERMRNAQTKTLEQTNTLANFSSAISAPGQKGLNNDAIKKDLITSTASSLGMSPEDSEYMSQQYDALRKSGMSEADAGAQISKIMNAQAPGQDVLNNQASFLNQDQANKINALQKLSGKDATKFEGIGGYKEGKVDLKDKSSIEGLSRARNDQTQLKAEADRLQHYVTNSKDAVKNAYQNMLDPKKGSAGDRAFFSKDPELKKWMDEVAAGKRGTKGLEDKMKQYIEKQKSSIAELQNKASSYGNLNSIDSYKEYLNKLGKVGTF